MSLTLSPGALEEVSRTIDSLLERPERLFAGDDAKNVAAFARDSAKLFFDAAQSRCPPSVSSEGLTSLVVAGFDCEQIWEELEVQNTPLRRYLRRRVAKIVAKPEIDLGTAAKTGGKSSKLRLDAPPPETVQADEETAKKKKKKASSMVLGGEEDKKGAKKTTKTKADKSSEDDMFFKLDDMEKFADMGDDIAEQVGLRGGEDSEDEVGSDLDVVDDDEELGFEDFYGKRSEVQKQDKTEDEEAMLEGCEEDDSDEEKELEAKLQAMAPEQSEQEAEVPDDPKLQTKSLHVMDARLRALEEEVEKLEEEQLQEKHWTLAGEVNSRQRPLNSLLEVHLDQPMTHFAGRRAEAESVAAGLNPTAADQDAFEDAPGADDLTKQNKFDLQVIIKQRVWDESFDDVVRKVELPPSARPQKAEDDAVETLNFEKSRVGLGDVYAKQYEAEFLGHQTDEVKQEDQEKTETKALFAKIMHKLDLLTNAHFTPRPPMASLSGEQLAKVPSLKMEEKIPLIMSDAQLKAPEELFRHMKKSKEKVEMTHDERTAARRAKKGARRKALEAKVESGKMTLSDVRERGQKLEEKNREAKREIAARGTVKERKTKLRASQLLEQAATNASVSSSRKEELHDQRHARPEGTPSSKRLKL